MVNLELLRILGDEGIVKLNKLYVVVKELTDNCDVDSSTCKFFDCIIDIFESEEVDWKVLMDYRGSFDGIRIQMRKLIDDNIKYIGTFNRDTLCSYISDFSFSDTIQNLITGSHVHLMMTEKETNVYKALGTLDSNDAYTLGIKFISDISRKYGTYIPKLFHGYFIAVVQKLCNGTYQHVNGSAYDSILEKLGIYPLPTTGLGALETLAYSE